MTKAEGWGGVGRGVVPGASGLKIRIKSYELRVQLEF